MTDSQIVDLIKEIMMQRERNECTQRHALIMIALAIQSRDEVTE